MISCHHTTHEHEWYRHHPIGTEDVTPEMRCEWCEATISGYSPLTDWIDLFTIPINEYELQNLRKAIDDILWEERDMK